MYANNSVALVEGIFGQVDDRSDYRTTEFNLPICGTGDPAISSLEIECVPDSISKNCKIPGYAPF